MRHPNIIERLLCAAFREPADVALIILATAMAALIAWLWFQIPACAPDSAGNCAFYSSP